MDQTKQRCGKQKVQVQQQRLCWGHWSLFHDKSNPSREYSTLQFRRCSSNVHSYLWCEWGRALFSSFSGVKTEAWQGQVICCMLLHFARVWGLDIGTNLSGDICQPRFSKRRFTVPCSLIIPQRAVLRPGLYWHHAEEVPWAEKLSCWCSLMG